MKRNQILLGLFGISVCFLNLTDVEAIVGGNIAVFHDFRYHVTVMIAAHSSCGGGIIEENFVITAAHCVIGRPYHPISKPISVLTGTRDLSVKGLVILAKTIFIPTAYGHHIHYSPGDIAILKLTKNLELKKHGLISLYFPRNKKISEDHKTAKIAGVGWDHIPEYHLNGTHTDDQLRYAEAVVRTHNECKADHRDKNITPQHLCAKVKQDGVHKRGVCNGDEGGPLVREGKNVIGILSVPEIQCSEQYGSGIYIRTAYYKAFKRNVVGYKGPEDKYKEEMNMRIIPIPA